MTRYIYVEDMPGGGIQVRTVDHPPPRATFMVFQEDGMEQTALAYAETLRTEGAIIVSTLGMTDEQRQAKRDRDAHTLAVLYDLAHKIRYG